MDKSTQSSDTDMRFGSDDRESDSDALILTDFQWTDYGSVRGVRLG